MVAGVTVNAIGEPVPIEITSPAEAVVVTTPAAEAVTVPDGVPLREIGYDVDGDRFGTYTAVEATGIVADSGNVGGFVRGKTTALLAVSSICAASALLLVSLVGT